MKRKTTKKAAKPSADKLAKFHIIWSPQSDKPPRVRFTRAKAEEVADIMVKKYHQQFYVMSSVSLHQMAKPERIDCTGKEHEQPELKAQIREQLVHPYNRKWGAPKPIWKTYNEWKASGHYVRGGERGTLIGGERKFHDGQVAVQDMRLDFEDTGWRG